MHPILIIIVLSLICAAALSVIIGNLWLFFAFFPGFAIALSLLLWIVLAVMSAIVPRGKYYREPSGFYLYMLNIAYAFVCGGAGVKIRARGLEKLPEKPFLLVSNHRSQLDNMVQSLVLRPRKIAFIAKEQLFKIPIVRGMITRCCYVSIGRKSLKGDKPSIELAEGYISSGVMSIGVYPEGHRSKDGQLLKFHAGSLKIAVDTGCPIVVSAIIGTERVHKRFPFRRTEVRFDIIDVIDPRDRKSVELTEEVREKIKEYIEENEKW